jgi:outer membrane protein assembly factor BamB/predicted phosphodiesterase
MSLRLQGRVTCTETGRGLADVLVSNGEQVVKTAADGSYQIAAEVGVHRFVWVCSPAGYHAADFYTRIPADDSDVDFGLTPAPERVAGSFRFVQITDSHVGKDPSLHGVYRDAIHDVVAQADPAFIIHSGDLTERGTIAEFESYQLAIRGIQTPIFSLFGNHDGETNRADADGADVTLTTNFNQVLGPAYFSFDWGPLHFCLYADIDPYFSTADRQRRRDWLRADLEAQPAGRTTILVIHKPAPDEFIADMNRLGVAAVLCGHLHSNKAYNHEGTAVLTTSTFCFGGIDSSPRSYRVLDVDGQTIVSDLRAHQAPRLKPRAPDSVRVGEGRLERVWSATLAGNLHRASPVAHENRLFVSQRDEDLTGGPGVICLDAVTGERQWETVTESAVKNRVAVDGDGHCAALGVSGCLFLLDTASGQVRWRRDLPRFPQRWLYGSPVVDQGHVYCGGRGGYGAWRIDTGDIAWYTQLDTIDVYPCYAIPVLTEHLLINVVQGNGGAVALTRGTGKIAWRREEQGGVHYLAAGPVLMNGNRVIMPGAQNKLLCLQADTGEEIWQSAFDNGVVTGLTAAGDRILVSTEADGAQCINADSGEPMWRFDPGPDLMDATPMHRGDATLLAAPVCWESYALVGGNDGVLYFLDAASGECAAQLFVGAPITAAPCVLADGLCVPTWDGRLIRYDVPD